MPTRALQKVAGSLAASPLLNRGRKLFAENSRDWNLSLSKLDKLRVGAWLILEDYSKGIFPPRFLDQQKTYQAERDYRFSTPGLSADEASRNNMTKPFWLGPSMRKYIAHFSRLTSGLESVGIRPPARILELGCGGGWMAEFLAAMGYDVCGTTISTDDVEDATRRIKSLEAKNLSPALRFVAAPMESVHTAAAGSFDAVFVYEALHHAFEWREAVRAACACLKPGGWLFLCNEPNLLHTFVSYRVAKLSNTHEIGFSKRELIAELRKAGFQRIISKGPKFHCWFRAHWLLAQK
jgi:2-polyprenyl-3-methyl-5-hydroxy-6-metoxy-1,4-benzoquinol methylase